MVLSFNAVVVITLLKWREKKKKWRKKSGLLFRTCFKCVALCLPTLNASAVKVSTPVILRSENKIMPIFASEWKHAGKVLPVVPALSTPEGEQSSKGLQLKTNLKFGVGHWVERHLSPTAETELKIHSSPLSSPVLCCLHACPAYDSLNFFWSKK